MRFGFSANDRLKKRYQFLQVQEQGQVVHTPHFLIITAQRDDEQPTRLGITVTRKVGSAVQRNHIKRLVREVFRQNRSLFAAHADVVVIAKRGAADLDYAGVLKEMRR